MRTIELNAYRFSELSKAVQEQLIEEKDLDCMYFNMEFANNDYSKVLEEFQLLTDTSVKYDVCYCFNSFTVAINGKSVYYNYEEDEYTLLEDLNGKLLFRYLHRELIPIITKGKCYSKLVNRNGKLLYKYRNSRITKVCDCPLTGTVYDYYILNPLLYYYNNWNKFSDDYTYRDLMRDCYSRFFSAWEEGYNYYANDRESIIEYLSGFEFYENGTIISNEVLKEAAL